MANDDSQQLVSNRLLRDCIARELVLSLYSFFFVIAWNIFDYLCWTECNDTNNEQTKTNVKWLLHIWMEMVSLWRTKKNFHTPFSHFIHPSSDGYRERHIEKGRVYFKHSKQREWFGLHIQLKHITIAGYSALFNFFNSEFFQQYFYSLLNFFSAKTEIWINIFILQSSFLTHWGMFIVCGKPNRSKSNYIV